MNQKSLLVSRWSRRGLSLAALLVCVAVVGPRSAHADQASARPFYDRGITEYNLGHFAEAIVQFEKAYEEDHAPILLFNIAQAQRQSGNAERALFFYRRYLEGDPNAANRADVEKRMAELAEVAKAQAEAKARPPTAVSPATPPPREAASGAPEVSPAGAPPPAGSTPAATVSAVHTGGDGAGSALKIAGIATASGGAASLLVGVYFSTRVSSHSDDVTNGAVFDPGAESSAKSAATKQWVFYGVGAAAIATGAFLYYFGHQKAQAAESRVALVPVVGPGQSPGAALWMSF